VQNIVLGVLIGLIYLNLDNNQASIQDRLGLLFFIMINQAFGALFTPVNICTPFDFTMLRAFFFFLLLICFVCLTFTSSSRRTKGGEQRAARRHVCGTISY
jgi:hypothetical protein